VDAWSLLQVTDGVQQQALGWWRPLKLLQGQLLGQVQKVAATTNDTEAFSADAANLVLD
jgi:hypothetical protein